MSLPPVEIPLGAMRFNSDSQKLEYFNGDLWFQVHTFNPDLNGGARGFVSGGAHPGTDKIEYVTIPIQSNAIEFGDLASTVKYCSGGSSNTRGVIGGGEEGSTTDRIQYVTISITGNATDFGNLTEALTYISACSNQTRLVTGAGKNTPSNAKVNTCNYLTIASTGNAKDFGDLSQVRNNIGAVSNPTRGLFMGGYTPTSVNTMDFVTLATLGNALDFGDLTRCIGYNSAQCGSSTRGIVWGGQSPIAGGAGDKIDYFSFATKGNTSVFGDSTIDLKYRNCTSDTVRGVAGGGQSGPAARNTIEYITIATQGNAFDFGDLTTDTHHASAAFSSGHGGLG